MVQATSTRELNWKNASTLLFYRTNQGKKLPGQITIVTEHKLSTSTHYSAICWVSNPLLFLASAMKTTGTRATDCQNNHSQTFPTSWCNSMSQPALCLFPPSKGFFVGATTNNKHFFSVFVVAACIHNFYNVLHTQPSSHTFWLKELPVTSIIFRAALCAAKMLLCLQVPCYYNTILHLTAGVRNCIQFTMLDMSCSRFSIRQHTFPFYDPYK
jgi:hypothetical protein